nr:MAG TPA: hypothetical protein [Caudoviricetes sp.]
MLPNYSRPQSSALRGDSEGSLLCGLPHTHRLDA